MMAAPSFSFFDDFKNGLHSTLEKARHKLTAVDSLQYFSVAHDYTPDVGLLPLERETSCLQEVLEQRGLADEQRRRTPVKASRKSDTVTPVEPSLPSLLVDFAEEAGPAPLAVSARSISYTPLMEQLEPAPAQRSISLSGACGSALDWAESEPSDTATLKPTPANGLRVDDNSAKDPFAFLDTFSQQKPKPTQPQQPKKATLGSLAEQSSWTAMPTPVLPYRNASSDHLSQLPPSTAPQPATVPLANVPVKPGQSSDQEKAKFDLFSEDPFNLHGFSRQSQGPRTIGAIRQDVLAKELSDDPDSLKVRQWIDGKQGNIRALLSTLHEILWDDESRAKWEPIPIHQLVKVNQVRRAYKRAAVVCHPDKLVGSQFERISQLVFIELNEASSAFQTELEQQS